MFLCYKYLSQVVNITDERIIAVIEMLNVYRYDKYRLMQQYFPLVHDLLPYLDGLPLSRILNASRITCKDLLKRCFWRGRSFKCCDEFHLQYTEIGFCISILSQSSQGISDCSGLRCISWATGPQSGLEIHLQPVPVAEYKTGFAFKRHAVGEARSFEKIVLRPNNTKGIVQAEMRFMQVDTLIKWRTLKLLVHDAVEAASIHNSHEIKWEARNHISIPMAYTGTRAEPELRQLTAKARRCVFTDEVLLRTSRNYTQNTCMAECRIEYIVKECGCKPSFAQFHSLDSIPECTFTKLKCLSEIGGLLINLFPNDERADGVAMNCSRCLPSCDENHYLSHFRVEDYAQDVQLLRENGSTYVDLYYDTFRTPVMYKRMPAIDTTNMLVSIGGIVSLCLGCSILSGVDIAHLLIRILLALFGFEMKSLRRIQQHT